MMPPKFYTWNELQAMSSDVPPRDIVRKFLSPGMTYEDVAPTHPYRSQILAPNLTNDIRSEEYRLRPRERANLYDALADYQSLYGIPVKVKTYHAVNPCDHVSIPRALEDAIIQLGSATNPDCPRYEIIPVLGREFVHNKKYHGVCHSSLRPSTWTVSLAGMKEIGLDLESLAATMGDTLAMITYKCMLAYFGSFFFRLMPIISNEHPGSSTVSLCIDWVHFSIIDVKILGYPIEVKGMLSHWKYTVPSPNESRYLWDVFKMAFISRGSRYCSIAIGITTQDMMRRFEML